MLIDCHIHVLKGIGEECVKTLKRRVYGSRFFDLDATRLDFTLSELSLIQAALNTPNCLAGHVSEGPHSITPGGLAVRRIIGEDFPVLDDTLIGKLMAEIDDPRLEREYVDMAAEFLEEHKGEKVFTVFW